MNPLESFELILGLLAIALVLPIIGRRLPLPPAAILVAVPGSTSVSRRLPTAMVVAGAAPARSGAAGIEHPRHWMGRHARRGESGRSAVVAA
jgi:hypothetical protein